MDKAPDAFRTISEVAEDLDVPQHVLRFWESKFNQVRPMKRGGGRRYYRPNDVELLRGIRHLLYGEGYTIRGVQKLLKERGAASVAAIGKARAEGRPIPENLSEHPDDSGIYLETGHGRDRPGSEDANLELPRSEPLLIAEHDEPDTFPFHGGPVSLPAQDDPSGFSEPERREALAPVADLNREFLRAALRDLEETRALLSDVLEK
ncbi:MerR family transcriptional regulator [Rhodoligotrophos ferricapiens]|uniref:MerR family transcriptional regulator n=1 Tax=Rhodoligotrophos ferricapiens TaxID=3069264 RepID=UPI00315D423C